MSLAYRLEWLKLGVLYARKPKLETIFVGGRDVRLSFPEGERKRQEHEFHKIVLEDCYQLKDIPSAPTVLDIGANIGLFAIAARYRFPEAVIHCYEPNPDLLPNLRWHTSRVNARAFHEAVGRTGGKISLSTPEAGSLFSVSSEDASGQITQRSFAEVVDRLGRIGLLKLDCEGAEWQIFEDRETWKSVNRVVMEYHLWAKPGSTVETVRDALSSLGFAKVETCEDAPLWGRAFASRSPGRV